LLYAKHGLGAVQVNVNTKFPQNVWCHLKIKGFESLLIGVCYRTPTERIYGINLHKKFRDLVRERVSRFLTAPSAQGRLFGARKAKTNMTN